MLWPFCSELETTVASLDVAEAFCGGSDAGSCSSGGSATGRIPPPGSGGEYAAVSSRGADAAGSHFFAGHEGQESDKNGGDFPCGIKRSWMEVTNAKTESRGRLEAAARGVHANGGRRKGVVLGEDQSSPILTVFIGSFGRACNDIMPPVGEGRRVV